jgi:hypothetical protein
MPKELPPEKEDSIEQRYRIRLARLAMEEANIIMTEDECLAIENTPIYKEMEQYPGD